MTTAPETPFAAMFAKPDEVADPSSILVYGPPGTYKTTIAGSIATVPKFKGKRILYIDIDRGATVLMNDPEIYAAVEAGTFNILPINKLDGDAFSKLQYFLGAYDEHGNFQQGEAFKYGYDVVILDSLDVAQEVAADWYLANTWNEQGTKLNTMKAWGEISRWTSNVAWSFQNSDGLGIIVMHSTEKAEDSGLVKTKPKLSGSAKDNIAAIPDLVAYVDFESNPDNREDIRLVATLGASDAIVSKNRWRLDSKIVDFDLLKFFSIIHDRKTAVLQAAA